MLRPAHVPLFRWRDASIAPTNGDTEYPLRPAHLTQTSTRHSLTGRLIVAPTGRRMARTASRVWMSRGLIVDALHVVPARSVVMYSIVRAPR
jgi:hypothetical protein